MPWSFLVEGDNVFLTMNGKKVFDYHGGDLGPIEKAVYGRNQDEIWDTQTKKRKLQYDRANLQKAFEATQRGISVYRAARDFCVPESTLRDRTLGLVQLDATIGFDTIFTHDEEQKLVTHITYMAEIGYGYNKASIQYMAKDFADSLGKTVKAKEALSNNWFYGFLRRWPNLKITKPQKLSLSRAKSASREALDNYYKELASVLTNNGLRDKPQCIFNVDETGVNAEHSPPKIVCDKNTLPQNITSSRSCTVTIIAAGNAIGNNVPPYYVFPGQRWNDDFLKGACSGSAGEMSKSGWSNSSVFQNYLTKHFVKYVKLPEDKSSVPVFILYDGHSSHISLTLAEWAKRNNVILFVLPPHSSHVTQPLDVGVFGPFKSMYYTECQSYLKRNPGMSISKYQIAELTAKPYLKALSAENLISAFRRTGIHPFDNKVITDSQVAPAKIYINEEKMADQSSETVEVSEEIPEASENVQRAHEEEQPIVSSATTEVQAPDFFRSRTITKAISKKPVRKFVPPFLAGNLMKKSNTEILKSQQVKVPPTKKTKSSEGSKVKEMKWTKKSAKSEKEPQPSTSGTNKNGKPLELMSEESANSESDVEVSEEEKCCMCHKWEPEDLRGSVYISLVSWGKCDFCPHWTHLKTCTDVRVLRRDSVFRCPHCPPGKSN